MVPTSKILKNSLLNLSRMISKQNAGEMVLIMVHFKEAF